MELVSRSFPSPFVIKLLEWFETPNGFLLILERPPNFITLEKFCNRLQGRVPEETTRIIMWQVIQAVRHCWKRGVVHRDIKERNILVNPETLEVKLLDFGLTYIPWDVIFKFKGKCTSGMSSGGFFLGNLADNTLCLSFIQAVQCFSQFHGSIPVPHMNLCRNFPLLEIWVLSSIL